MHADLILTNQHAVDVELENARRVDLRLRPRRRAADVGVRVARRGDARVPRGVRLLAERLGLFAAHALRRVVALAGGCGRLRRV